MPSMVCQTFTAAAVKKNEGKPEPPRSRRKITRTEIMSERNCIVEVHHGAGMEL